MKNADIKVDIPVNIVEAPDRMLKQAALISNQMRLEMHRQDVAATVISVYAEHGFTDIEQITLLRLEPQLKRKIGPPYLPV
jgi:hypothetical protein